MLFLLQGGFINRWPVRTKYARWYPVQYEMHEDEDAILMLFIAAAIVE